MLYALKYAGDEVLDLRKLDIKTQMPSAASKLHARYGDVVRIAPDEPSLIHPSAWKDIMAAHKEGHSCKKIVTTPEVAQTCMLKSVPSTREWIRENAIIPDNDANLRGLFVTF